MRRYLKLAGLGILAFGLAAAAAGDSHTPPSDPFHTCFSKYALCISAPCRQIPGTIDFQGKSLPQAVCECEVMFGYNIGSTTCEERVEQQQGNAAISTYSVAQTEGKGLLQCPQGGTYADCFNFDCTIDPDHPYRALCVCPVLQAKGGPFVTRGGQCRQAACSKLWSAAPKSADLAVNQLLWKQLGFTENPPTGYKKVPPENFCPDAGDDDDDGDDE